MPRIIGIERKKNWVELRLDGAPAVGMRAAIYRLLPAQEGEELDLDAFTAALAQAEYQPAMDTALTYLATRPRSRQELQERLRRAGYHAQATRAVLERLEALNLTGDEAFAVDWAQARGAKALGKRRIAMELRQKGVDAQGIEAALGALDPDALAAQAAQLAAKLRLRYAGEAEKDRKRKVIQALQRRGFDWSQALDAYRHAAREEQADGENSDVDD